MSNVPSYYQIREQVASQVLSKSHAPDRVTSVEIKTLGALLTVHFPIHVSNKVKIMSCT